MRSYGRSQSAWHANRVAGAKKTLEAIQAWQAEAQRRRDAVGLTAAREAEERARSVSAELRDVILAMEATTYRELAFQAAVVDAEWNQQRAVYIVERLAELAGIEPYMA